MTVCQAGGCEVVTNYVFDLLLLMDGRDRRSIGSGFCFGSRSRCVGSALEPARYEREYVVLSVIVITGLTAACFDCEQLNRQLRSIRSPRPHPLVRRRCSIEIARRRLLPEEADRALPVAHAHASPSADRSRTLMVVEVAAKAAPQRLQTPNNAKPKPHPPQPPPPHMQRTLQLTLPRTSATTERRFHPHQPLLHRRFRPLPVPAAHPLRCLTGMNRPMNQQTSPQAVTEVAI